VSAPERPLLAVRDLVVHYGVIQALSGISLQVNQGQVVALIGANGAGKSTTLRAISGLVRPTSGSIAFRDAEIGGLPSHDIVARGVAQAPEGRGIFLNLTVRENWTWGPTCAGTGRPSTPTGSGPTRSSPSCGSGASRCRGRSPAASSRCWRWRGR
jgi:ABC-type branched-subunit amino acid transport system ATPase component